MSLNVLLDDIQAIVNAICSGCLDQGIIGVLRGLSLRRPKEFRYTINRIWKQLPLDRRDRFNELLTLVAMNRSDTTELLSAVRTGVHPKEARIVVFAPNASPDVYLSKRTLYPGGATGTIGSILARCGIPAIICGFLGHGNCGEVFRTLAAKQGIDTSYLIPVKNDSGFTVFLTPSQKLPRQGPLVTQADLDSLLLKWHRIIALCNREAPPLIIFSGSVPPCEGDGADRLYYDAIQVVRETQNKWKKQSRIWLDAKRESLHWALQARPDYVKINHEEFADLISSLRLSKELVLLGEPGPSKDVRWIGRAAKAVIDHFGIPKMTVTIEKKGAIQVGRTTSSALVARTRKPGARIHIAGLGDTLFTVQAIGEILGSDWCRSLEFGVAAALASAEKPGTKLIAGLAEAEPYLPLVERRVISVATHSDQPDDFKGLLSTLSSGQIFPTIVVDMDGALTPSRCQISADGLEAVLKLLDLGSNFVILTSSGFEAVRRQVLAELQSRAEPSVLRRCFVFSDQGSQAYGYNVISGRFERIYIVDLNDPEIVGAERVKKAESMILATSHRFGFKGTNSDLIDNRGSQITLMILGNTATPEQKEAFDAAGGRATRLRMAAHMNRGFRRERIPVYARPAGKSSINIAPLHIDKSFGIRRIVGMLGIPSSQIIYIADEFWPNGVDEPVIGNVLAAVNVGPALSTARPRASLIDYEKLGPTGTQHALGELAEFLMSRPPAIGVTNVAIAA